MPLTPPPPGAALVIAVSPAAVGEASTAFLSRSERELAASFHFEKDADRWRSCRAALRAVLGNALGIDPATVAFQLGEFGKPALPPPWNWLHFNLSHCHDLALIALCRDGESGIDVEPADRAPTLIGCEHAFCHHDEMLALPAGNESRSAALLEIWTAKEALLKALGTGMSVDPRSVSVASLSNRLRLHRLTHPALENHIAHLAAPPSVSRVTYESHGSLGMR